LKKIFKDYIRPKVSIMSFCLVTKFTGTIIELLLPWMLSVILDKYAPVKDTQNIFRWGILMVVTSAAALFFNIVANRLATKISRDITQKLRYDLFRRTVHLSSAQQDAMTVSSLISRLTTDTYNVHQMVDRMQRLGVRAPILLLGGIIVTFLLEPVLTLILVVILPLLAIIIFLVSVRGISLFSESQKALDRMILRAQESMGGIRVIQALSKTDYEVKQFAAANSDSIQKESRANMLMNLTNPVMNLLLNIGLTLVIVVGAFRVNAGITQPGIIIAFLSYFTIILTALMMISRMFVMLSKGIASANRISQVLQLPNDMVAEITETKDTDAHISFENVSFSYGKVSNSISDISFKIKQGETLGIIGSTGSGKTTLINLLLRFYDVDKGAIYINGSNVKSLPPEVLHSMFGVVFQNDFLYAGEIVDNIRFGRDICQSEIEEAVSTAQAEFVFKGTEGLKAELAAKGANFSGGQKQRLLIARAVAANPSILILDDSSSALDYKTDARLRRSLAQKFPNTTKIIVAQRVSSIKNADKIIMLDEGSVLGYGTHEKLMQDCASYREIAKIQMKEVL